MDRRVTSMAASKGVIHVINGLDAAGRGGGSASDAAAGGGGGCAGGGICVGIAVGAVGGQSQQLPSDFPAGEGW